LGLNLYEWIRKTHLYVAMVLLTFVVMYFITGYVMLHPSLPRAQDPQKVTTRLSIDLPEGADPEDLSVILQDKLEFPGKRIPPRVFKDGRIRYLYYRPGESFEATLSATRDSVVVVHTVEGMRRTLFGLHRMHNYGGGWLYDIWVLLYDLASLSLILFALTGVYMWFKLTKHRMVGWIFLATGYGYTLATVLYLVHAR